MGDARSPAREQARVGLSACWRPSLGSSFHSSPAGGIVAMARERRHMKLQGHSSFIVVAVVIGALCVALGGLYWWAESRGARVRMLERDLIWRRELLDDVSSLAEDAIDVLGQADGMHAGELLSRIGELRSRAATLDSRVRLVCGNLE